MTGWPDRPWAGEPMVTGEAVALDQSPATVPSRAIAFLIDILLQGAALLGLTFSLAALAAEVDQALGDALGLVTFLAVGLGYPVALEALFGGRTIGKAALGLRVVRDDGGPIRFRHALLRGLAGLVLERPGLTIGLAALVTMFVSRRSKRLGDLLAGTVVVQERVAAAVAPVAPVTMPAPLAGWAATLDLSRLPDDLALGVRQFLARQQRLSPPARADLEHRLADAVAAVVNAPPPPGTPESAYLAAVLAERRRREELRLRPGSGWIPGAPPHLPPSAPPPAGPVTCSGAANPSALAPAERRFPTSGGFAPPG